MSLTEFNEEEFVANRRAEGRIEGHKQGTVDTLVGLVKDGLLSLAEAAKRANMSEEEFEKLCKEAK